jgi:putative transposase
MKQMKHNRYWLTGGTFFFTVNLHDRKRELLTQYVNHLRAAVKKVKSQRPFTIHAWVVLPEHMHCIWQLPENDTDYATRWRLIKTHFTRQLPVTGKVNNSRQGKNEQAIWQRRYWEHTIRDDLNFKRHMDYVHINPVKHGYVNSVKDWPYSSFH